MILVAQQDLASAQRGERRDAHALCVCADQRHSRKDRRARAGAHEGARGVDVLLSEVGFTSDETEPDMHMDGVRAGEVARRAGVGRMIATHIQPWTPRDRVAAEVRQTWSGPLDFATSGMQVSL